MKISKCRSCNADIVWMKTFRGKNVPVNPESIVNQDAALFDSRTMIAHFSTCPDADKFRKPQAKPAGNSPAPTQTTDDTAVEDTF